MQGMTMYIVCTIKNNIYGHTAPLIWIDKLKVCSTSQSINSEFQFDYINKNYVYIIGILAYQEYM